MRDWRGGRRNWSPNEMALQAAEEYEEERLESGTRTDLRGEKTDTARIVGERYGKTDRWVREAVGFAKAVKVIQDNAGIDFPDELIQDQPRPANRDRPGARRRAAGSPGAGQEAEPRRRDPRHREGSAADRGHAGESSEDG
jgi:hypothetical protein